MITKFHFRFQVPILIGSTLIAIAIISHYQRKQSSDETNNPIDKSASTFSRFRQIGYHPTRSVHNANRFPKAVDTNVIIILADDLGFADFSHAWMPRSVDLMNRFGTQARFYTTQGCVPTRAALMTGYEPIRIGLQNNPPAPAHPGLPDETLTLPELMRIGGYDTYMIGKWHLGLEPEDHPLMRGFDEFLGAVGGSITSYGAQENGAAYPDRTLGHDFRLRRSVSLNGVSFQSPKYSTYLFRDAAVSAIENSRGPFFLYVPFNAPHSPYSAPRSLFDDVKAEFGVTNQDESFLGTYADDVVGLPRNSDIPEDALIRLENALYYASVRALDHSIAKIYDALIETGVAENTLFIFASDNGARANGPGSNAPFRGGKGHIFEGAIRVANFIIWPEQVSPGQRIDANVWIGDLLPTCCEIAGVEPPNVDGGSIIEALVNNGEIWRRRTRRLVTAVSWRERNDILGHFNEGHLAILLDNWKFARRIFVSRDDGQLLFEEEFLFDLQADPKEEFNLAEQPEFAEQLAFMQRRYLRWGGDERLQSASLKPLPPYDWSRYDSVEEWGVHNTRLWSRIFP